MQKPLCPVCYSNLTIREDHKKEGVCYCQDCGKKIFLRPAKESVVRFGGNFGGKQEYLFY